VWLLILCCSSIAWSLIAFFQPGTRAALQLNSTSWSSFNWSNIIDIFNITSNFYRGSGRWAWDLIYIPSPFEQFPLIGLMICMAIYITIRYCLSFNIHTVSIDLAFSMLAVSFLLLIANIGRFSHSWYISGM